QTGKINEMNIDFSGGTEKTTYFFSAGFRHDEGITIAPVSDDIYIGVRNNFKVKKWFRAGDNLAFSYKISRGAAPWDVKSVINMPPYFEVKDANNFWGYSAVDREQDLGDNRNPVALSALTHPKLTTLGYNANLWAEIEPLKDLVYRIQAGINGFSALSKVWNDAYEYAGAPVLNNYAEKSSYSFYPVVESYLTYKHRFARHDLTMMVGNSWQDGAQTGSIGIAGQDYALTAIPNVFNAANRSITNEDFAKQSFLSYFGRVNYQFDNRYLLTFNVRRDGSPRFAPSNRWATFPSIAVGWKLQEIPEIKALQLFDELKLRMSFGSAGNDGIGDFKYVSPVWTNGVYYPFGLSPRLNSGATVIENSSQSIRWETTISKTAGVDLGLLNNALQVSMEFFMKNTRDILFNVPRATSLGYGYPPFGGGDAVVNAASCLNQGFEFQIKYRRPTENRFSYWVSANVTLINNKVTSLGLGQPYLSGVNKTSIGRPIGYFYGYVAEGVFMTQREVDAANALARQEAKSDDPGLSPSQISAIRYQETSTSAGDIKFKDLNGDGKVTVADQTMIGNSIPKRQFGLFGNLKYGSFDLDLYFQGTGGYQIFYRGFEETRGMQGVQNQETYVLDRWKSEADPGNGKVPRAMIGDPSQNNRPSTRMITNGDYFKLRQMSIGYTIDSRLMKQIDITSCRLFLTGSNIFTITPYKEFDPEYSGPNLTRGADWLNFPINPRYIVAGLKITL
ncbi:MAG: SusC/RagA family TonB-linked outer membrane protein, partial [Chitinophagaceae bacterium]